MQCLFEYVFLHFGAKAKVMSQSVHGLTLTCSSHLLTKCQQTADSSLLRKCNVTSSHFPFLIFSFLLLGSPLHFCIQQVIKNGRQERPVIEANREVYHMHASKFFENHKVAQTQQLANTNSTSITATERITRTQLASDSRGMKKSWFVLSSDSLLHIRNATTVHIDHIAAMSLP